MMDDLLIVILKLAVFLVIVLVISKTKFFKAVKKRYLENEKNK